MINNNIKSRSRFARYSWLAIGVFFILFYSCPVKRFFKLQLYKHPSRTESQSSNLAFAKELKDGNLINKQSLAKLTSEIHFSAPDPKPIGLIPLSFILSALFVAGLFPFFKRRALRPVFGILPHFRGQLLPLFLLSHRLQV
jgi:hypothetical protein